MRGAHEKERATPPFIRVTANQAAKHGWEYRWIWKIKFLAFNAIHQGVLIHWESTLKLPGTGSPMFT